MGRLLKLLTLILFGTSLSWGQTTVTVTGNLADILGTNVTTNAKVCFSLIDALGNPIQDPRTSGNVLISTDTVCVVPNGSGVFTTSVVPNNLITPANTQYSVQEYLRGSYVHGDNFTFNSATPTYNLNTATPNSTSSLPVVPQPSAGATSQACTFTNAVSTWTCSENMGTTQVMAVFRDSNGVQIFPDKAQATDGNTYVGTWLQPQAGSMTVYNVGQWTPSLQFPNYLVANPSAPQTITGQVLHANGGLAVDGDVATTLGGSLSAKRIENVRVVDANQTSVQAALTELGSSGGKVFVSAGTWTSTSSITCANAEQLIEGVGDASVVQFTGATDGFNNCYLKNINVQTTNAAGGVGVKFSGLWQQMVGVHISKSGSGKWAKGFQDFGGVTSVLDFPYCETGAADVCVDTIDNAGFQVGALKINGGELRGNITGLHLDNVLSCEVNGGAIEGASTNGVLADSNPSFCTFNGTHFENNGTNDFSCLTSGSFTFNGIQFLGGTTNNFNAPNTTCTAKFSIFGSNSTTGTGNNWIFGNSISRSIMAGNQLKGGALSIATASLMAKRDNRDLDGSPIADSLAADSLGNTELDFNPGGSGFQFRIVNDHLGNWSAVYNGIVAAQMTGGSAIYKLPAGTQIGSGSTLAKYNRYSVNVGTLSAVAANTTAEQCITSALTSGDVVVGVSKPTAQAGLGLVGWRANGTSLCLTFSNNTASPITPTASESYAVVAVQ